MSLFANKVGQQDWISAHFDKLRDQIDKIKPYKLI